MRERIRHHPADATGMDGSDTAQASIVHTIGVTDEPGAVPLH